ncbi:MAG TPA: acyl-CoA dehydrogenase family protein [Actinomycetota bacterium]|nr:acyl-CoA dehydrogenase family protein [Actinomycetota bacterium]
MTFAFTEEQQELRSTAARFLDEKSSSAIVRELMETDTGFDEGTWKQMADLGWFGMAIPEEYGGLGFGFVEVTVLLEEMGRKLLPAPYLSSVIFGANAILNAGTEDQRKELLPGIADGTTRATLAFVEPSGKWDIDAIEVTESGGKISGTKSYVLDGHTATLLIVAAKSSDGLGLYLVDPDAEGVTRTKLETLDMTRKQAKIDFNNTPATRLGSGDATEALQKTLNQAAAVLSAEMVGGAQQCLDMSTQYAKERYQFGRPIGSFQAIKHKCANMLMEVEMARSAAYYAGWAAAEDPEELPLAASLSKAYCSDAYFHAAAENIQIHGGIGFTWEHDAHLYFRRAKSSEIYLGDATYHRELVAQKLGV